MKTCFIVGYGPGVAHGAARAFAEAGYQLVLFCRTPGRVEELYAPLGARAFAADAGQPEQLSASLKEALEQLGAPEVLIYNAVAFRQKHPSQLTAQELLSDFSVNVVGASVAVNCLLPGMKSGSLLFSGGGWALYPDPSVASTAIGKAGLRHYALMLSEELKGGPVKAGTLTILGQVAPGGAFDPEEIGRVFLRLHQQSNQEFQSEVLFSGRDG
ncbi:SDR family NAD(P)-dependent oxidoreductase [bacterium]|nr:SDR family NAD(P)-dependent oxidoreductase [bacterium]